MFKSLKARLAVLFACVACICAVTAPSAVALNTTCPWACADQYSWAFAQDGYNPPVAQGLFPADNNVYNVVGMLRISSSSSGGYTSYVEHAHFQEQHYGLFSTTTKYYSCGILTVFSNTNGALVDAGWYPCVQYA